MPRLQVLNGKRQGVIFEVKPGTKHVVGHRQTASITIDDPWVSWDHAQLFWNPDDGECWIEDLGSTNGTYLNRARVTGAIVMKRGDRLQVGNTVMELA